MRRMLFQSLATAVTAAMIGQPALAVFDLQITEIWPGNEPGSNLTDDWFEITNFGNTAWTAAVDGDLYYDDDSADASVADLISGVASIASGESVIFVDGSATTGGANVAFWHSIWDPDLAVVPQVGTFEGSGLGQGGDGVALFLDANFDGPQGPEIIDFESYPDANTVGGQSYDAGLGVFSSLASNFVTTTATNDGAQPAIGTPGFLGGSVVPEPTTIGLAAFGLMSIICRRRN